MPNGSCSDNIETVPDKDLISCIHFHFHVYDIELHTVLRSKKMQ